MKIAAQCQSPLLQKSLELFLDKHLSSTSKCDILIRDSECLNDSRCFHIGTDENADLKKPFCKSQLILALEEKYKLLGKSLQSTEDQAGASLDSKPMDFSTLEKRIETLTHEYQSNIIRAVRAFYEN